MAMNFFRRFFDTSEREVKALMPTIQRINEMEEDMKKLSLEDFGRKTDEFKKRLENGETLDDILPEAFALCREAGRRTLNMRHFDVQLLGGIVLHQGRIAEMRTGEGKTLVATLALYLNSLEGKGSHLVTVNDYLARRDAIWMGPIYHMLGLSVGIIQGQSAESDESGGSYIYHPGYESDDPRYMHCRKAERREAYLCDITYGTNHEFGFDYLRDNMAFDAEELSQRTLKYAIIDEVDSILIDEARTPHIISGAVQEDVSRYKRSDQVVKRLMAERDYKLDEKAHSVTLTEEGIDRVEQLLGIPNLTEDPEEMHFVNASLKAYGLYHKDKEYVAKDGEILIVDEFTGRLMFGRRFSDGLHQAIEAKEGVPIRQENQTIAVVTFQNLFRLYKKLAGMTGTAKTEEDEFRKIYGLDVVLVPTNKPMIRTDFPDQIYKTEEAKFRGITFELLRLYAKQQPVLVGTRSIQMSERVSSRLTFDRLQLACAARKLQLFFESDKKQPKDKKQAWRTMLMKRIDQISPSQVQQIGREVDVNVKMTDQENIEWLRNQFKLEPGADEYLEEALKHGIPHNILNAKYHEKEALIIAEAGVKGRVTIATNMAGRGVDILLGGTILPEDLRQQREELDELEKTTAAHEEEEIPEFTPDAPVAGNMDDEIPFGETFVSFRRGGKQRAAPPLPLDQQQRSVLADEVRKLTGVYILGTERHESRRIDNQLRGRSGRQGDPGESQFFVSMEDELMRLFGEKTTNNPLLRAWPEEEPLATNVLSKMIEKAQQRIEFQNFQSRKYVLEYDDVLNVQRDLIYKQRRQVLLGEANLDEVVFAYLHEILEERVSIYVTDSVPQSEWDIEGLYKNLCEYFPLPNFAQPEDLKGKKSGDLVEMLWEFGKTAYEQRLEEFGSDELHELERYVILRATNSKWMEHLAQMDYLREGIGLRGYAQIDPLVAYKKEAFEIFKDTMANIRNEVIMWVYHARVQPQTRRMVTMDDNDQGPASGGNGTPRTPRSNTPADPSAGKVGRNDPCPCGSGLKYKKCHGK